MSGWDDTPVNAGSGWHDTPAPAGFTTGLDSNDKHANDSFGDENDEGVMLNGGQSGGLTGECYNCGEVGHNKADCNNERVDRPFTGECFNCGQEGHSKADCTNERVERPFTGTCHVCAGEGHRAASCPDRPADICRNCKQEGHRASACESTRAIDRSGIPDMTLEEAVQLLKEAADEKDSEQFKLGIQILAKRDNEKTYLDIENMFRTSGMNLYLIALEREIPKSLVNVNLQGVSDCTYLVGYFFSPKAKRVIHQQGWPATSEDNLERLQDAGEPMVQLQPVCRNCNELGHISKRCPNDKVESSKEAWVCANCGEPHMTRYCTSPREDRSGSAANVECRRCNETGHFAKDCPNTLIDRVCRNCGEEGHISKECDKERNPSTMTCRNCNQQGHMAKDCTEPRDMSTMVCRNCDETGHQSRECPKPRDYSRVKCNNCNQMGHTSVRCKEPPAEGGEGGGFDTPADNGGGFDNGDTSAGAWNAGDGGNAVSDGFGWQTAPAEVAAW